MIFGTNPAILPCSYAVRKNNEMKTQNAKQKKKSINQSIINQSINQ
jgi:hypothetical protein